VSLKTYLRVHDNNYSGYNSLWEWTAYSKELNLCQTKQSSSALEILCILRTSS